MSDDKIRSMIQAHIDGIYVFSARLNCDELLTDIFTAYESAKAPGLWQPIETAPKDGSSILLFGPCQWEDYYDEDPPHIGIGYYHEDEWREPEDPNKGRWRLISDNPYSDYCQATHWMPLPPEPKI